MTSKTQNENQDTKSNLNKNTPNILYINISKESTPTGQQLSWWTTFLIGKKHQKRGNSSS